MKEKILSIVPEAILEEKHGIWFVSVPRTSFHDLALRLRNDEDTSFDFLVCMTGMDWGETLGVMYHLRSSKYGHDLALRVETENRENPELPSVSDIWATANLNEREVFDFMVSGLSTIPTCAGYSCGTTGSVIRCVKITMRTKRSTPSVWKVKAARMQPLPWN